MAGRVAASLCVKYGLKLGEGQLVPMRHFGVYDPVAELLSRRSKLVMMLARLTAARAWLKSTGSVLRL